MQKFTPFEYLLIDIANAFGHDKITWKERIAWTKEHLGSLNYEEADEPARAYSALKALEDVAAGKPTGHMVAMDATASGIQIIGVLAGERFTCEATNALDTGERRDVYTDIYEVLKDYLVEDVQNITRDVFKPCPMQSVYGGTKTPKEVLGEANYEPYETVMKLLLPRVWELREFCLDNWNPDFSEYTWTMPDNFHVVTPVYDKITEKFWFKGEEYEFTRKVKQPTKHGKKLCANLIHSVDGLIMREMTARCMYSEKKINKIKVLLKSKNLEPNSTKGDRKYQYRLRTLQDLIAHGWRTGYWSFRILDMVDDRNYYMVPEGLLQGMIDELPKKPFEMVGVHDCFLAHPNYVQDVREQYRNCLVQLSESNLLEDLLRQMFKKTEKQLSYKKEEDLTDEIYDEEYAIC